MYGLYLKYFHKDNNQSNQIKVDSDCIENPRGSFWKNIKNESIPFQIAFITVTGGSFGMLSFFIFYPFKRVYQPGYGLLHNRNILMDRITKPFGLTILTSYLLSFVGAIAFVTYNSRNLDHNNNDTNQ